MKLVVEAVRDEALGPCFFFHGDVDAKGLHSFAGTADSFTDAVNLAMECIQIESEFWGNSK